MVYVEEQGYLVLIVTITQQGYTVDDVLIRSLADTASPFEAVPMSLRAA
jgi:hypothetical protein